jgi:uncharacterized membrane protein YhfC
VLALALAAPWFLLLAGGRLRNVWLWVVFAIGAVLFPVSIAWVQVPIQQGVNELYLRTMGAQTAQSYALLTGIPVVLVAGLVQEVVKFGDGVAGLYLAHARHSVRTTGLAMGAAAGAGYGAAEAFWVFNQVFGAGFTLATVQLAGRHALLPFIERFFTVMFHTGVVAVAVYGYASRRPWRYLLLAIVLHTLVDYLVLPAQLQLITPIELEVMVAAVALATLALALWLRSQAQPQEPQPG